MNVFRAAFILLMACIATAATEPIQVALYQGGFQYQSESDSGIDKEVAVELGRRLGLTLAFDVRPRARIWADLEAGTLAVSTSGIQTPQRDQFAWFAHYIALTNHAIVRPGCTVRTEADLWAQPAVRVGRVRGFLHRPAIDAILERIRQEGRLVEVPDTERLAEALAAGACDIVFMQEVNYRYHLPRLRLQDAVILDWSQGEGVVSHGMILAKSHFSAADAERWRAAIAAMREDGTLLRIFSRYVPAAEAAGMMRYEPAGRVHE